MKKYGIHYMTWKEIDTAFKEKKIILIPMGSMEQHGGHSINGDYLAATYVAEKVAEKTDNLFLPTIPFGNSSYFKSFPGTISLREATVTLIIKDVIENLINHNQYEIIFLNGHAGNKSSITTAVRELKELFPKLNVHTFNLWQTLTQNQKNEMYPTEEDPSGHGAEPLTSIMRYLYPNYIDSSKTDFETEKINENGKEILNLNQMSMDGINVDIYVDMKDISEEGIYSNSFKPSAEIGKKALEYIVNNISEVIKKIQ